MAEFKIKIGSLELRSCDDPYVMAEFVFTDESGKEIVIGAYEAKSKGWVLKVDFKAVQDDEGFVYDDYKKLEHLLLVMTSLFLSNGQQMAVSRMDGESFEEIEHMMDDMTENEDSNEEDEDIDEDDTN